MCLLLKIFETNIKKQNVLIPGSSYLRQRDETVPCFRSRPSCRRLHQVAQGAQRWHCLGQGRTEEEVMVQTVRSINRPTCSVLVSSRSGPTTPTLLWMSPSTGTHKSRCGKPAETTHLFGVFCWGDLGYYCWTCMVSPALQGLRGLPRLLPEQHSRMVDSWDRGFLQEHDEVWWHLDCKLLLRVLGNIDPISADGLTHLTDVWPGHERAGQLRPRHRRREVPRQPATGEPTLHAP